MNMRHNLVFVFVALLLMLVAESSTPAQRRDYMTDAEVELVRNAQNIDLRIEVLTRMIDRRLVLLGLDANGWREPTKAGDKWGDAPAGTRLELVGDVRNLLQKAVDDVDDVAAHNEDALTQNKMNGELFPKAVRALATAAKRYKTTLGPFGEKATDLKEQGLVEASLELCDQIVEAAANLPAELKKGKH